MQYAIELSTTTEQIKTIRHVYGEIKPEELAQKEDFWQLIQHLYEPSTDFINLENGYYGALPVPILEAYVSHIREINKFSSFYMRRHQDEKMNQLKENCQL